MNKKTISKKCKVNLANDWENAEDPRRLIYEENLSSKSIYISKIKRAMYQTDVLGIHIILCHSCMIWKSRQEFLKIFLEIQPQARPFGNYHILNLLPVWRFTLKC